MDISSRFWSNIWPKPSPIKAVESDTGTKLEVLDTRAEQRTGISEVLVCQHLSDQPHRRDQRNSEGQRETGRPVLRPLACGILREEQSRNRTQDPLPQPRLPQVFRRLWGLQVN